MKRYIFPVVCLILGLLTPFYGQDVFERVQYEVVRWQWERKLQAITHRADMRDMNDHYIALCYGVGD